MLWFASVMTGMFSESERGCKRDNGEASIKSSCSNAIRDLHWAHEVWVGWVFRMIHSTLNPKDLPAGDWVVFLQEMK